MPVLATARTVAVDGLSICFDLREGETFSSGALFDAMAADWNPNLGMGMADVTWIGISDADNRPVPDAPDKITVKAKRPGAAGLWDLAIVPAALPVSQGGGCQRHAVGVHRHRLLKGGRP